MDSLGAGVDGSLVVIRAIHFAATAVVAGSLVFRAVVAEPALRSAQVPTTLVRAQILVTASTAGSLMDVAASVEFFKLLIVADKAAVTATTPAT